MRECVHVAELTSTFHYNRSRKIQVFLFIPLHSMVPSLFKIGDISKRQVHLPSRHSVRKLNASHCSLKKQLSFTDASVKCYTKGNMYFS